MTLLDRTIARQFAVNALVLLVILFSFVVAIDLSLKLDDYAALAAERAHTPGEQGEPTFVRRAILTLALFLDLWWPRLIQLFNYILGVVMVGAMGFTLTQMVRNRELVAVLASGISLWRVARPIVMCALAMSMIQLANQEFLIPRLAPLLTRDLKQAGQRSLGAGPLRLTADSSRRVFYAGSFDADAGVLIDLHVLERDEKGMPERSIVASKAVWREDRWILSGGSARGFAEGGAGMPEPVASLETNLDPTALKLRRFGSYRNSLSFAQVSEMLAKRELLMDPSASRVDEWERIRYGRFGVALCNLLGVVICLPFFLRREPIVMIAQSLKAAPLAVGSLMGGVLGASAAIPALPPQVSVFIPAIILLPLAIASITSVRT